MCNAVEEDLSNSMQNNSISGVKSNRTARTFFTFFFFQLAMWATYKSEIMEREMDEKDFLKNFYERNRAQSIEEEEEETGGDGEGGGVVLGRFLKFGSCESQCFKTN